MFQDLSLRSCYDRAERKTFRPGEFLFHTGEMVNTVIIIEEGSVVLTNQKGEKIGNENGDHSPRVVWGLKESYLKKPISFSVQADEPSRCLIIPAEYVLGLLDTEPGFKLRIMDLLASDLGYTLPE